MSDGPGPSTGGEGGGRRKWLIGAAAAVLVLGGGYVAWSSLSRSEDRAQSSQTESVNSYASTAPPEPSDSAALELDAASEPAATPTRRRAPAQPIVPEETIGVAPEGVTPSNNDEDEIVVTAPRRPVWTRRPSARTLSTLYPERALERGREGEALLHCLVENGGALRCEQTSATPGGFGPAAIRVARTFRHAPTLANGASATGSPLNLRVVFRLEDERRGRRR